MALLIGAFLATSIVFGLLCLLFRGNRKFILIGFITWFICAFLYGFGYDSGWFIGFCFGLLLYLWGAALWTILALYFVKKKQKYKNNNQIYTYYFLYYSNISVCFYGCF